MKRIAVLVYALFISVLHAMEYCTDSSPYVKRKTRSRRPSNAAHYFTTAYQRTQIIHMFLKAEFEALDDVDFTAQNIKDINWDTMKEIVSKSPLQEFVIRYSSEQTVPHRVDDGFTYICRYIGIIRDGYDEQCTKLLDLLNKNRKNTENMDARSWQKNWLLSLERYINEINSSSSCYMTIEMLINDLHALLDTYQQLSNPD